MIYYRNWTNETFIQATNTTQQPPVQSCMRKPAGEWSKSLLILVYVIIFLVAIGGNSFIIHIVRVRQDMKTTFNYLIVNMAVADILDALVAPPTHVGYMLFGGIFPSGPFGEIICKLQQYLIVISISASVLTLIVIAIDRYFAIVHERKRSLSIKTVKRTLGCIWIISGVLFSYELYRMQLLLLPNSKFTCGINWGIDFETNEHLYKADMMVKLVLLYVVPLIVMITFYSIILVYLSKRKCPQFSERIQKNNDRRRRKVIKVLVTIVTVFAVCWLPSHINHTLTAFYWSTYRCSLPYEVMLMFYMAAHASAAINPCLYATFNKRFQEEFKVIFGKVILRKKIKLSHSNCNRRGITEGITATPTYNTSYGKYTPQLSRILLNIYDSGDMAESRL